nr:MAG TPA: hypothetical protein [Caudoviricetes sp.]
MRFRDFSVVDGTGLEPVTPCTSSGTGTIWERTGPYRAHYFRLCAALCVCVCLRLLTNH